MLSEQIENYILLHTTEEDPLLHELYRETNLKTVYPHMLSGHLQGRVLEMLSRMINPMNILEIGTFTGYSAICLARGLKPGGKLVTIEVNPEYAEIAKRYFDRAGLNDFIEQVAGHALEKIPGLNRKWNLVFIDADKENYLDYYNLVIDRLTTGGYIFVDNVLWDGKVLEPKAKQDKETRGISSFNEFIRTDARVEHVLLPVRDGLMILRKKQG